MFIVLNIYSFLRISVDFINLFLTFAYPQAFSCIFPLVIFSFLSYLLHASIFTTYSINLSLKQVILLAVFLSYKETFYGMIVSNSS